MSASLPSRPQGRSRREERANRILDAAAASILRWGYDKTTVDDIARQAGVAKGTIYLHWRTREDLVAALFAREGIRLAEDIGRRVDADPLGGTLRGFLKHSALAVMKHSLLKAVLLRDVEVLGRLVRDKYDSTILMEKMLGFRVYLDFLRERGLVRTDLDPERQEYVISAIYLGFFLVAPLMPAERRLTDEALADLMAETAHRAIEIDRPVSPDEARAITGEFSRYLDRLLASAREQLRRGIEPTAPVSADTVSPPTNPEERASSNGL